ncbi:MAG TPA: DUF927 domain-containing protein [Gemmataceae bacterium]|nr:DUF927 domain-containing protein [Gemmataceae bacterium]
MKGPKASANGGGAKRTRQPRRRKKAPAEKWDIRVEAPVNGRVHKSVIKAVGEDGGTKFTHKADLMDANERHKAAAKIAQRMGREPGEIEQLLERGWNQAQDRREAEQRARQEAAAEPEAPPPADSPWREADIPSGYRITASGLVQEKRDDGGNATLARSAAWVEAFTRDSRYGGWGVLLGWLDRDGRLHSAAFPAGRLHEQGNGLVEELAGGGLAVVPGKERDLLRYLAASETRRRFRSVSRLGWVDPPADPVPGSPAVPGVPAVFVLPDNIIGAPDGERIVYQPEGHIPTRTSMHARGTLAGWQDHVARKATGNPVLLFGLAAAFAGPLLKPAGLEGGGFHLYGLTSRGKTTQLQMAGSVWGCGADPSEAPDRAFVRKWNMTANAAEGLAEGHCDCLLALDEIGEAQLREFFRTVYMLAGGQGKSRMGKAVSLREQHTWRVLLLSTGEVPARDALEAEGRRARGGQLVRLLDIPATVGNDDGVIHDPHGLQTGRFVNELKRACAAYYGTAGPAFLKALCAGGDAESLACKARRQLDAAHARLTPGDAPPEVQRAVKRFALVEVAGQLACAAGVLPQSQELVEAAVDRIFRRWLEGYGGGGEMARAVAQLREFLLRNEARFRDCHNEPHAPPRDLAGYRDRPNGLFLLTPDGMKEALDGHSVRDVARHLKASGLLFTNEKDKLQSKHRVAGIDQTVSLYAVRAVILGEGDDSAEIPE